MALDVGSQVGEPAVVSARAVTNAAPVHYGTKPGHFETLENSLSHERGSEQSERASERVSERANKQTDERAAPVRTS